MRLTYCLSAFLITFLLTSCTSQEITSSILGENTPSTNPSQPSSSSHICMQLPSAKTLEDDIIAGFSLDEIGYEIVVPPEKYPIDPYYREKYPNPKNRSDDKSWLNIQHMEMDFLSYYGSQPAFQGAISDVALSTWNDTQGLPSVTLAYLQCFKKDEFARPKDPDASSSYLRSTHCVARVRGNLITYELLQDFVIHEVDEYIICDFSPMFRMGMPFEEWIKQDVNGGTYSRIKNYDPAWIIDYRNYFHENFAELLHAK